MKLITPVNMLVAGLVLVGSSAWYFTHSSTGTPVRMTQSAETNVISPPPGLNTRSLAGEEVVRMPGAVNEGTDRAASGNPAHYRATISDTLNHMAQVEKSPLADMEKQNSAPAPWTTGEVPRVWAAEQGEPKTGLIQAQAECYKPAPLPSGAVLAVARAEAGLAFPVNFEGDAGAIHYQQVTVDLPGSKVFLVLTGYGPAAWRVRVPAGQELVGVWATGYHKQAVLGVDPAIVHYASYMGSGCDYLKSSRLTAATLEGFGVEADAVRQLAPLAPGETLATKNLSAPYLQNFIDPRAPINGSIGMATLEAMGFVGPAAPTNEAPVGPPVYRVIKPYVWPAGLAGAHAVTVQLEPGQESPSGDPGHSQVILTAPAP